MTQNVSYVHRKYRRSHFLKNGHIIPCVNYINIHKRISMMNFHGIVCDLPYGLAVRIPGFHPGGPGSTPGMGTQYLFHFA